MSLDRKAVLLNGCNLVNRCELSRSQDRELQRYIDANSHLLRYGYRDVSPSSRKHKLKQYSRYADLRNQLNSGIHFNPNKSYSTENFKEPTNHQRSSRIEENQEGSNSSNLLNDNQSYNSINANSGRRSRKEVKWSDTSYEPVKRTRSLSFLSSLSPTEEDRQDNMSHYGSSGNLNRNDQYRTISPTYSAPYKQTDHYTRFETSRQQKKQRAQQRSEAERSRFSGYGDRPGSGIELMPQKWHGGEIIPDPEHLPKSLKPRRIYYSPIGDGVVAADGVEMKHAPKDVSPRISVTHVRTYDRGEPGRDGYNIYEKITSGSEQNSDYGSGRNSRTAGTLSPSDRLTYGHGSAYGDPTYTSAPKNYDTRCLSPGSEHGAKGYVDSDANYRNYGPNRTDSQHSGNVPSDKHDPFNTIGSRDHYGTLGSTYSDPFASYGRSQSHDQGLDRYSSHSGLNDGRLSAASTGLYGSNFDGKKYDVQTEYLITNPRELIHQYATTTPVAVLQTDEGTTSRFVRKVYTTTTEEKFAPYPPYKGSESTVHPNNFVRQLRDENLTISQREANRHRDPLNPKDVNFNEKLIEIRRQADKAQPTNDVDYLTEKMIYGLRTGHPTPPSL